MIIMQKNTMIIITMKNGFNQVLKGVGNPITTGEETLV
jgi:hypothetical protein